MQESEDYVLRMHPKRYGLAMQVLRKDAAMLIVNKGGIDLGTDKALLIQNNGQGIKFHLDPAQLLALQNAPGFMPIIVDMQPVGDIRNFLGVQT